MAEAQGLPAAPQARLRRRRKTPPNKKFPPFAAKADDLEALKKAIEDAASVSGGLWLSYLFVLFYIAIAAGAVTHADLLLETPVKLPFLNNISLPLKAFFFLAPFLFLIMHAYTLAHFVLLADKIRRFHDQLHDQIGEAEDVCEALRRQLPSNIFVQFLAGPRNIRVGGPGWLLKVTAWTTLVFGPILLLLLLQIQFLPYHDGWITWTHRLALLLDFLLLCWLWPKILKSRDPLKGWRWWASWVKSVSVLTLGIVAVVFSWAVATFPGEWQEEQLSRHSIGTSDSAVQTPSPLGATVSVTDKDSAKFRVKDPTKVSIHDLIFKPEVNWITRRADSLIPNAIILPGFNIHEALKIDDPKKADWHVHLLSLRGRDLKGAVFDFAVLPKVDFEGADLRRARFILAKLQEASFDSSKLQGASLDYAQLPGASFAGAELQGASLDLAHLEGTSFWQAKLQGASLVAANLQGATFTGAQLQGASLAMAQLQAANLMGARFQGGSLDRADLRGASLAAAELQGAVLDEANLSGASLVSAQLQGASLKDAKLANALLPTPNLWRARFEPSTIEGATMFGADFSGRGCLVCNFLDLSEKEKPELSPEVMYQQLKSIIEANVPLGPLGIVGVPGRTLLEMYGAEKMASGSTSREAALKRIEVLDPARPFHLQNEIVNWKRRVDLNEAHNAASYGGDKGRGRAALAVELKTLVCSVDQNSVYALLGRAKTDSDQADLSAHGGALERIEDMGANAPALVEGILKPDCPVFGELSEHDKTRLRAVARRSVEAAAKTELEAKEGAAKKPAEPAPSAAPPGEVPTSRKK